jgi:RNA polymerase sigma-70 factor (ECF subfamily)
MTEAHVTDGELVRRAREGDGAALRSLFGRHRDRLEARVRRRLSTAILRKVSAADVLQEAYLTAHERLSDFEDRGDGSFGRWLGRIVDHKLMHAVRRFAGTDKRAAAGEVTRGGRCETGNFPGRGPTPSQLAIAGELRERTRRALAALPEDHRRILDLRQEEHLSLDEAAERLGRTREATRKLYSRALARLAELLGIGKEASGD